MSSANPKHILTAPAWPYANGPRHIGHVSGFALPSDMFSRYQRMAGNKVLMVSGTDEHGTPIQVQADKEGVSAREVADRYNGVIGQDLANLGMSYDLFTRTTTRNHYAVVQEIFTTLLKQRVHLPEDHARRDLAVHRPHPARPLHRGHLPDLRLPERPRRPVRQLRQPARPDRPDQPDVADQRRDPAVRRAGALLPRPARVRRRARRPGCSPSPASGGRTCSSSRSTSSTTSSRGRSPATSTGASRCRWTAGGTGNDKRIYVWFDAVIGYLSASVEWARRSGDPDAWRAWWNDENAEAYYFMGKDNIVFHAGDLAGDAARLRRATAPRAAAPGPLGQLDLPSEVVSSEFLTMEGRKFSSSRQVVIYVRDFLDRYDVDALRYYVAVAGPGDPGHRLHLERVRPQKQRRTGRYLGKPRQSGGIVRGQEHRLDPGRLGR